MISQKVYIGILNVLLLLGQPSSDRIIEWEKGFALAYQNPDTALDLGYYFYNFSSADSEKISSLLLISQAHHSKAAYLKEVETLFEAKSYFKKDTHPFLKANILLQFCQLYRKLGLTDKAFEKLSEVELLISKITDREQNKFTNGSFLCEKALLSYEENNEVSVENSLKDAIIFFKSIHSSELQHLKLSETYLLIASMNIKSNKLDAAKHTLKNAAENLNSLENHSTLHAQIILESCKIKLLQNSKLGISDTLVAVLKSPTINQNKTVRKGIYMFLSKSSYASGDMEAYKEYNQKYKNLNDSMYIAETEARIKMIQLIEKEKINAANSTTDNLMLLLLVCFLVLLLLFLFIYIQHHKAKKRYRHFQEVMLLLERDEKLKIRESTEVDDIDIEAETDAWPAIIISEKTKIQLLEKLEKFEESTRFINKQMSLQLLAKQMDTNTKYLSEIINKHKQKNFKSYLHELRINYIIHKLRTDPSYLNYKTSYLAEACGFASRSTFTAVFKEITNLSPTSFMEFLKKDMLQQKKIK